MKRCTKCGRLRREEDYHWIGVWRKDKWWAWRRNVCKFCVYIRHNQRKRERKLTAV